MFHVVLKKYKQMWPNAKYIFALTAFASVINVSRVILFIYVGSKFASEIKEHTKEIKVEVFRRALLKLLLCWLLFILLSILKEFLPLENLI
jgi:hypothetical protein